MAAHVQYQQMRDALPQVASRRPFSNTGNQMPASQSAPSEPPKPGKQGTEPPLPRQNTKTAPPSPPQIIRDNLHSVSYQRVGFLGEVCVLLCLLIELSVTYHYYRRADSPVCMKFQIELVFARRLR